LRKVARRKKAVFGAAVGLTCFVVLGTVGLLVSNVLITREKNDKQLALEDREIALTAAQTSERDAKEHNVPDEMPTPNANGKYLQLHFTVEDPNVFTTKWSATMTYRNVTGNDVDWVESVCAENTFWFPGQESDVPQALKADF